MLPKVDRLKIECVVEFLHLQTLEQIAGFAALISTLLNLSLLFYCPDEILETMMPLT